MQGLFGENYGKSAVLSECRTYRYLLGRKWDDGPCVTWLMLNPSTADADVDDHTIRKCVGFSRRWGFGRLIVVNLFALRATDPRFLAKNLDPVGPENDFYICEALREARQVICAWGCEQHLTTVKLKQRVKDVCWHFPKDLPAKCLGFRKDDAPKHPLTLSYETKLVQFKRA